MSYKTILVQVDDSRHAEARIEAAANIAVAEDAHLVGLAATGVAEALLYAPLALSPGDPGLSPYLENLRQRAAGALDIFENIARRTGVASHEPQLVENETATGVSLRARCCDLVVLGQPDPDEESPVMPADFPEYVAMNCGGPVLMMPYAGRVGRIGERALIAWNASIEASRALRFAIPLLQRASSVEIAIFNADAAPENVYGVPPGAEVQRYLARHGIKAVAIAASEQADVGRALLALAESSGCDLLVTGCYGHARFREILLGGVTRTLLKSATVPLLMAH